MEAFETTLTGSDGNIDGIVTQLSNQAYQFTSLDDALHLTIVKNEHSKWVRLSGSEPYLSGWVDELSENIAAHIKGGVAKKTILKTESDKKITTKTGPVKKARVSSATTKK